MCVRVCVCVKTHVLTFVSSNFSLKFHGNFKCKQFGEQNTNTIYELTIFVVGLCVLFLERNVAKG